MKPKTIILMVLAVTCGLGASYMTNRLLAERTPTEEQKVAVLVAKRPLSIGEMVRKPDEMFETKEFAAGKEPKEAFQEKDLAGLKGKIMKGSLRQGDHITPNDLSGEGGLQIPDGHYAMGFPVNNVTSAHGFASLPLSRVDVLLTIKRGDDKSSKSKILLRNILVLAADGDPSRDKGIAALAAVVTFALKPEEALKMQLAQQMGSLTLALRKPNDRSVMDTADVNGESITSDNKKEDEAPASLSALPKLDAKPAPSNLPDVASKPAPPPTVAKDDQPKPVDPPYVEERPKGILQTLTIINEKDIRRIQYRTSEDGQQVLEADIGSGPTPPRKKSPPQKSASGEF